MKFWKKTDYTYTFSYLHAFLIPLTVMIAGCIGYGIEMGGRRQNIDPCLLGKGNLLQGSLQPVTAVVCLGENMGMEVNLHGLSRPSSCRQKR